MHRRLLVASFVAAIAGCTGPQGEAGANGADGTTGATSLVNVSVVAADAACPNGGLKIDVGVDDDRDGTLDAAEIDQSQFVCNGSNGSTADAGTSIPGATSLLNISTSAPDATCVTGGLRVDSGLDDDRNGTLDAAEIDQTRVLCNGSQGPSGDAGAIGLNALINTTVTTPDATCAAGGVRVEIGLDDDDDDILDAAEIDQTQLICNGRTGATGDAGPAGLNSLVHVTTAGPDITCANGGTRITAGVDDNANGSLDPAEVDHTQLICNGAPLPPTCTGPWRSLHYDPANGWRCVDLRATGLSAGNANGFEVIDAWGDAWDGNERAAKNWADANADCTAKGGRLPTATELFRNNATSGTGTLGNGPNLLWTLIFDFNANRTVVRLSFGEINSSVPTATNTYRCIWPNRTSAAFDGDYCHGPVGTECQRVRRWYNMDTYLRAPLDAVAASHECNFYNASLPTIEDWTEIAHTTGTALIGTDSQWANDPMFYPSASPYMLQPLVRWDATQASHFAYASMPAALGDWAWPNSRSRFRCIGKRQASEGVDPVNPVCAGTNGCFTVRPNSTEVADKASRRSPLWADGVNRSAATKSTAAEQCRLLGGALPTAGEFEELVHAGLPFLTSEQDTWLWAADPIRDDSNLAVRRYSGWADRRGWYFHLSNSVNVTWGSVLMSYRCVWHQTQRDTPFTCGLRQDINYDGTQYTCMDRTVGDANGSATGTPFTDNFGNVWDGAERTATSFSTAGTACAAIGGRLPTGTELWRVRSVGPNPIPNSSANALWTRLPSYRINYAVTERTSDGTVSDSCTNGPCAQPYRCIWPASSGSVLSNYACNGPTAGTDDPCFRAGRFTVDEIDRAPMYAASAAEECKLVGGWLQSLRGYEELVHAGVPNGSNNWNWLANPAYSNGFMPSLARWNGVGTSAWYWGAPQGNGSVGFASSVYPFRCAFHDFLR